MSKARANADAISQAYIENIATDQNLSGTYSTERMYFNDSYKLTGDVNITGHLALATAADSDVVITQDSTERTITGSGTLESGDLLHRPDTSDLTGMTGDLGSAVTGSPALNLSNATSAPAGYIIKSSTAVSTSTVSYNGAGTSVEADDEDITVTCTIGNKLNIFIIGGWAYTPTGTGYCQYGMRIQESGKSDVDFIGGALYSRGSSKYNDAIPSIMYTHTALTTSVTIKRLITSPSFHAQWAANGGTQGSVRYLVMEEQA